MLPFDLSMWLKRAAISLVGAMALLTGLPSLAHAQVCLPVVTHSCLNITFSPNATTPTAADFANGVAVLGSFNVSVLKCGRPPCRITVGAQGQPREACVSVSEVRPQYQSMNVQSMCRGYHRRTRRRRRCSL